MCLNEGENGRDPLRRRELIKVIFGEEAVVSSMQVRVELTRANYKILRNFCKLESAMVGIVTSQE